jgi:hypothetical protein
VQEPDNVADQVAHRKVAGDQQEHRVADHRVVGDLARARGGGHQAEEVLARVGAALGEEAAHVRRHLSRAVAHAV